MRKKLVLWFFLLFSSHFYSNSQSNGSLEGYVKLESGTVEFASVFLENTSFATYTTNAGKYILQNIPEGTYTLTASFIGYKPVSISVNINSEEPTQNFDIILTDKIMALDEIVVTGTKTFKRKTNSPVIVNVVNSVTLNNIQACNLSEGLRFQPGLRVETDCQTCNYTQLRMNGLSGGYSQILVNGRPIFSPLTGLYGLEQLPVNMIDRIEVIRGGGSSLYGSSAIGGTVNVITKIPKSNNYEFNYNYQNINGQTSDHQFFGNSTVVSSDNNAGISLFLTKRQREFYDHNDDNFSEIPKLENTAIGGNFFSLPSENQKLELSFSNLNEYRYGGEMTGQPAYLTQQSEERTHNVWMANADYQINFNNNNSSFLSYIAWQNTDRDHYTGILPEDSISLQKHLEKPPYGTSSVTTYNIGTQLNHKVAGFISGINTLTLGVEYLYDKVFDEINSYNYLIDQTTKDLGAFVQSDWQVIPQLTVLTGLRMDHHNLLDNIILSPRASLLYKWKDFTQLRLNYGSGFRAPQAFDTDLHIAFAGGGVSRIILSPALRHEKSRSFSGSINFDRPMDNFIIGFTLEGFYTRLLDAFILRPIGEDDFGELFRKENGQEAVVKGVTLETRMNYNRKIQLEAGITVQSSSFDQPVQYIDELEGIKEFIRTPNTYGFTMLSLIPNNKLNANLNYVFTGKMKVPHFAGAPNQEVDEIINSPMFHELSTKLSYAIKMAKISTTIEIYGGVKNVFNSYQSGFDIGKNRDSNFVFGPAQPRTIYLGIKLRP